MPDEVSRFKEIAARKRRGYKTYETNDEKIPDNPTVPTGQCFLFRSPVHLLLAVSEDVKPYAWQREELLRIAGYTGGRTDSQHREPTPHEPYRVSYVAANGSGKDFLLIAATAIWCAMRYPKTRVVITSASWTQLEKQTEPHIVNLIGAVNRKLGTTFNSVRFKHHCPATGSVIDVVLSDNPGMIEGYHPWPGGKLMIILNECKTITDDIQKAWKRCNGFSWWIQVSSPGAKEGFFYRDTIDDGVVRYPEPARYPAMYSRVITAYDCPHLPRYYIDECIRTMPDWWVKSSLLAQFFSTESDFIITEEMLLELDKAQVPLVGDDIGISLDSAAGGDETSLYGRRGNGLNLEFNFRNRDTVQADEIIHNRLIEHFDGTKPESYRFFADDGGISQAFVDRLVRRDWHVKRIHNQAKAEESDLYVNLGAEMYFHLKHLIQMKLIQPIKDEKLRKQLCSRRYDQIASGKLRLEAKADHRARTGESPDRADAVVLCFASLRKSVETKIKDKLKPPAQGKSFEQIRYDFEWKNRGNLVVPSYRAL